MAASAATAATLTPIPAAAQQRALALYAEGAEVKAARALREDTFLALLHSPAALAALVRDGSLPATPAEAAARLAREDAQLHDALLRLLAQGDRNGAVRQLRRATDLDLANAHLLVRALERPAG
ncbi:hypothetical protein ACFXPX_24340 [Kitasatospora sp. NPDC059146]|uniref:hypothetical protein n=1 Tax=Kitasatospora sp. NPDC059146 TaxID=3346741 RepID=UPI0036BEF591